MEREENNDIICLVDSVRTSKLLEFLLFGKETYGDNVINANFNHSMEHDFAIVRHMIKYYLVFH